MCRLFVDLLITVATVTLIYAQPMVPEVHSYTKISVESLVKTVKRVYSSLPYILEHVNEAEKLNWKKEALQENLKCMFNLLYYMDEENVKRSYPDANERYERYQNLLNNQDDDIIRYSNDRLATEAEIERVLHIYRPFTERERKHLEQEDDLKRKFDFIDNDFHNEAESKFYRSLVKKYYVIDPNLIYKLLEKRYQLLREILKGRKLSELNDFIKQTNDRRITAQFKLWKKNQKSTIKNEMGNFALIINDLEYRKFQNLHDDYCPGNIIYGYKNRYDDPTVHAINFDVTASRLLGKRFVLMHELSNELRKFDFKQKIDRQNFHVINFLMEYFNLLTNGYPRGRFRADQWSPKLTPNQNEGPFMLIPRHYETKSYEEIRKKIDDDLRIEKATVDRDLLIKSRINVKKFQKSLLTDRRYLHRLGEISTIQGMSHKLELHRLIKLIKGRTKLLETLKETSLDFFEIQPKFGINEENRHDFSDEKFSKNNDRPSAKDDKKLLLDQTIIDLKNSFDLNKNSLILENVGKNVVAANHAESSGNFANQRFGAGADNDVYVSSKNSRSTFDNHDTTVAKKRRTHM